MDLLRGMIIKDLPVAAILLASGFSKRFGGENKLLFPFRGKPLARYTLELAVKIGFKGGIFFVTASDAVSALACGFSGVQVIKNAAAEKGLRESVRLGVEAADGAADAGGAPANVSPGALAVAAYYMFFVCDQPFLDEETVKRILDARQQGHIVEPHYRGRPGNPCLFCKSFKEELLSLEEGETPKLIKTRHRQAIKSVEVYNSMVLEDIDDAQALERLLKL